MKQDKIILLLDPEGNPHVTVEGVTGKRCKEITRALEAALGVTESDTLKPEFHRTESQANVEHDTHSA